MNGSHSVILSTGAAVSGYELFYLAVAGLCLLTALHYLRRMAVPVGPLVRAVAAAAMVALTIGGALVLLLAIAIGGN
ncbi:hypothetical protein [Actinoplanes sp. NPDC051411]|uniref:hypothetical protein n=1 Tax=Actinoplanes sp. NPDC051411 TaxID=3155522 RepID=UPI0034138583